MGMDQNPGTPGESQNSWVKMDVNNPLKMVLIGIDPYPYQQYIQYNGRPKIEYIADHIQYIFLGSTIAGCHFFGGQQYIQYNVNVG
jgi:hypothetical protein